MTPSGTAGSQILSASWTITAPAWVDSKNGWYASAGSITRIVASAYKISATQSEYKNIMYNIQNVGNYGISVSSGYRAIRGVGGNVGVYGEGVDGGVYGYGYAGVIGNGTGYDFFGDSGNPSKISGPMYSKCGYIHGNNVVIDGIFDTLSPVIPNINDIIKISGSGSTSDASPNIMVFSHAIRTSSTRIMLYGIQNNTSGSLNAWSIDDGSVSTEYAISIAWG